MENCSNKLEVIKMADTENTQAQPEKKFRAGGVVATVWKNTQKNKEGKEFDVHSINVDRTYKDGDEFKQTSSMKVNDLPKLALVADQAFKYLTMKESTPDKE